MQRLAAHLTVTEINTYWKQTENINMCHRYKDEKHVVEMQQSSTSVVIARMHNKCNLTRISHTLHKSGNGHYMKRKSAHLKLTGDTMDVRWQQTGRRLFQSGRSWGGMTMK